LVPEDFNPEAGASSFDEFLSRYLAGEQARQARSIDLSRFLTARTQGILQQAGRFALERGQTELDALHILRVIVEDEAVKQAIARIGVAPERIISATEARLPAASDTADINAATITPSASRALFHAYQVARSSGSTYIDPEHLFFALVLGQDAPAGQVLARAGVTAEALTQSVREAVMGDGSNENLRTDAAGGSAEASETPMLDKFGTDLTQLARDGELDPVIGRVDEIEQTIEILSRRTKNNPVLIGEAGVGKTAIVEGLARAIVEESVPEALLGKRVISLDLPGMLAGTRYRGDFEERLTKTMEEIAEHKGEIIVFIDELHTVVGAGGSGDGGTDAGNILKPRLARGELHLVGATTLKEYRRIEKDPALERRFQPVTVGEPSIEDAVLILSGLRGAYEEHHGVEYTDAALRASVELSARYLTDRVLPDKAIDLIDQAAAKVRLRGSGDSEGDRLRRELQHLEDEKAAAVRDEAYEDAAELKARAAALEERLAALGEPEAAAGERVVAETDVAAVIAARTGIPVGELVAGELERLHTLEEDLHRRVVGQDAAVGIVSDTVRRARVGLAGGDQPLGTFLFLGPTGVGKTELVKALAERLFATEKSLVRIDMSEFREPHTVARLIGSPPGYVGYGDGGQLTEPVRRRPYSVILLDEIEKAHPEVWNVLLQVMDDGRLTDGEGRTVDFTNAVIVMTSNLGAGQAKRGIGFTAQQPQAEAERMQQAAKDAFLPEFINRIDEIVTFAALTPEQVQTIAAQMVARVAERLHTERGIELEVDERYIAELAQDGFDEAYGARPLQRHIRRTLEKALTRAILAGEIADGDRVQVDADGALTIAHALVAA
jgi:ATP-dependent Clp protease ATP-binding subunit ClpC